MMQLYRNKQREILFYEKQLSIKIKFKNTRKIYFLRGICLKNIFKCLSDIYIYLVAPKRNIKHKHLEVFQKLQNKKEVSYTDFF